MEINIKPNDKIIELGGGSNPTFHPNLDIRSLPNVDLIVDFNNHLPIPDNSYSLVYSKYLIEHVSWRNVKNLLKEIYRILNMDGRAILITANLLEQARVLVNSTSDKWNDDLIGMIFGAEDYSENTHRCGFSPEYINKILKDIGFNNIKINPIYSDFGPTDMIIEARK